jgi:hypothetical protein
MPKTHNIIVNIDIKSKNIIFYQKGIFFNNFFLYLYFHKIFEFRTPLWLNFKQKAYFFFIFLPTFIKDLHL